MKKFFSVSNLVKAGIKKIQRKEAALDVIDPGDANIVLPKKRKKSTKKCAFSIFGKQQDYSTDSVQHRSILGKNNNKEIITQVSARSIESAKISIYPNNESSEQELKRNSVDEDKIIYNQVLLSHCPKKPDLNPDNSTPGFDDCGPDQVPEPQSSNGDNVDHCQTTVTEEDKGDESEGEVMLAVKINKVRPRICRIWHRHSCSNGHCVFSRINAPSPVKLNEKYSHRDEPIKVIIPLDSIDEEMRSRSYQFNLDNTIAVRLDGKLWHSSKIPVTYPAWIHSHNKQCPQKTTTRPLFKAKGIKSMFKFKAAKNNAGSSLFTQASDSIFKKKDKISNNDVPNVVDDSSYLSIYETTLVP
ncbi:hypothetical protein H4219_003138 [Mycoemilia scoparia]|uniref:Uncharacterized protein n=1 Tax=Mycoemilia scoparia TaxID=417184 RepID=A0A9W7ZVQ6_9FUNG|nr:hypothetical protein H4219_003138 [Mycoemilia scoparia]